MVFIYISRMISFFMQCSGYLVYKSALPCVGYKSNVEKFSNMHYHIVRFYNESSFVFGLEAVETTGTIPGDAAPHPWAHVNFGDRFFDFQAGRNRMKIKKDTK